MLLFAQVLGGFEKFGVISAELDAKHNFLGLPSLPLHPYLRSPWNAALRWRVSLTQGVLIYTC